MANQEMYKHDAMLHMVWCIAQADKTWDGYSNTSTITPEEDKYLDTVRKKEGITIDWDDFNAKRKRLGSKENIIDEACKALRGCGKEWKIKSLGYMMRMGGISEEDNPDNNLGSKEWNLVLRAQKELGLSDHERKSLQKGLPNDKKIKKGSIVSIWSPLYERFIKMNGNSSLGSSPLKKDGVLPANWDSEKFLVVDAGDDKVAFWNLTYKHFIKMYDDGKIGGSPYVENGKLPRGWPSELFIVNTI
jgi:hypothetical protein